LFIVVGITNSYKLISICQKNNTSKAYNMKKIIVLAFLLIQYILNAQNETGGEPVFNLAPIPNNTFNNPVAKEGSKTLNEKSLLINTAPTGTSPEVGITEGELSVSLTGAATYNIPIAVPPGINGVVPQVSLAYSSQSGNGMAGYGWNITGVSMISRIPRTMFHDGVVGSVNLDANDRFALDGQRLIAKTGVYGANGTVYETENFSNIKITSSGVSPLGANYGPASFKVEYPDGSIAEYGISTDTRCISSWYINYWQNPQSVRISYSYNNTNNNVTIASIKYGVQEQVRPLTKLSLHTLPELEQSRHIWADKVSLIILFWIRLVYWATDLVLGVISLLTKPLHSITND
jgi:hypothetical protein